MITHKIIETYKNMQLEIQNSYFWQEQNIMLICCGIFNLVG